MEIERSVARVFQPLLAPARYKGLHGGRGSGKSHFFAEEAALAILQGKRVLCVREVQRSIADSVKRLIEDKINALGLADYFDITQDQIRCPRSGGFAIFRGMQNHTSASVKSLEGFDVAWWEEAQTSSQRSLDLLIPTIRTKGSELWFSWNPENDDDPVDVLLRKHPPENAIVEEVNWDSNPWFPDELRQDMERDKARDPDKFAHVWQGEYKGMSEARVFRHFASGEINVPDRAVWFYGLDFGFSQDPLAGVRFCFPDADTLYVRNEIYEIGVPLEAHPPTLAGLPDAAKWPIRADNARPEVIDYCRRHGFPKMRGAKKGKGSVEDGISFIQSYDVMIHPECPNTLKEFQTYAYKTDPRTNEVLPVLEDKNNHAIDALRYGCEGLHRKGRTLPGAIAKQPAVKPLSGYSKNISGSAEPWKVA